MHNGCISLTIYKKVKVFAISNNDLRRLGENEKSKEDTVNSTCVVIDSIEYINLKVVRKSLSRAHVCDLLNHPDIHC